MAMAGWTNGKSTKGGRVKTAEFDLGADGKPDQRFTHNATGQLVLIESEPDSRGQHTKRVVPGSR